MGEESKPKLINFYSWLESKLPENRFQAILNSIIEPMQNQGVEKSTITAILKQLSMDCKVILTPLPLEFVQQHITRPQSRSCSPVESDEVINISSDESSDEAFFIKPSIHSKNRKLRRICSDDDDEEVSDDVTSEIGKSSSMETEIQVSIKVYGSANTKSKNIVKDNQEVYPTAQPINLQVQNNSTQVCSNVTLLDRSNISVIELNNSSPSNENEQLRVSSDDICFDKLNIKKRVKIIECFGEDSGDIPELKKKKLMPSINKNNQDKSSLTNCNKPSTKDSIVKKKRRKRKHSNDIEHSSVLNTEIMLPTYKSEANNKKDRLVEKNQTEEKLPLDIKNKSNNKKSRRKRRPKSRKNNSKENSNMLKRNASLVSSDSGHHFTDVTPVSVDTLINNTVDQLWSNLGMESPTERSGNILKSFPLCTSTTYTDSNSNKHDQGVIFESGDKVSSQKDSNTNKITNNLNHLEDKSKFQVLTNEVVRTVGQNDMDAISDVRQIKNAGSISFPHLEENINVSEAINSYDKTSKNNLEHENVDNVGKIRLRDPKTLMKNSENIHFKDGSYTLPVNNVIIHSPNQASSNRLGEESPPPSYVFHYFPNSGQSSEIRQKKDCGMKVSDDVGLENQSKTICELYKWFFDEVIELKSAKMSEILHLVIADKICKDERVKRATKLMSKSSIAEEKRRVDREYSDTLRIRGNEFKALFNDIVDNFSFLLSKEIMIIVLYCKIINGLLKIEDTNKKYCMSARTLICEILKKNNYKNPLVYDLLSLSDTNFEQKYNKVQSVLSILIARKSDGMHINNTKSSAKENPSHETESQMSNACNEVSLAFNLGRKLDQLIKNKEYHISVHQQNNRSPTRTQINIQQQLEMACDAVQCVPENESINNKLVPSSVIKHASTPNTVTCLSSFTNCNQSILPVHSVLNTTQEHQQKMMKPPLSYSMHASNNIARVNPNINSDSRSIEDRNSNCNVRQKIGHTQSSRQINYQASAQEHVSQFSNQQAQNIQTSTDKSHYYKQQFSEHQKIAHMQDGYKQLSPQTQQVGTSIETQKNNYIPVATQQQQNMQPQNIYGHLPLETQQPKQIHNSYRGPQYAQRFVQPHNSSNVQQMHRSKSIENEQNTQKQTNYGHLLTQLAGAENNNNYREVAKPTNIENGEASNHIQTPEQHVITSKEQNNINYQNHPVQSQRNNQSELYNYGKDNPHSISYARLRQTSAIQEHREIKRALVQPMVYKSAGQFTPSVQSQNHEINLNNSMLHNENTTLSQTQLTFPSKEMRSIFLDPKRRPEIQKLVGQKSTEYWEKSSNQVQSNTQNNHSNKTDFRNETQETTVSNPTSNPLTYTLTQSKISDNVSSYVTQQNTLHTINNIIDSRLNHQNNVSNQNQQTALSSLPSNPISSPRHCQTVHTNVPITSSLSQILQNTSPQRSSSSAASSSTSSLKHGQTVNTNIIEPSSLYQISQSTSSASAASSNQISSPRHCQTVHTNVPITSSLYQISQSTSSATAASSNQISSPRHCQTVHTNVPITSSLYQISQSTSSATAASSNQISSPRHCQTVHTNVPITSSLSQILQNTSPQRSSSSAASSSISSLKHGQTVNTNISEPSSLCQISQNTSSSIAASSSQISSPKHSQTVHINVPRTSNQSQISQNTSPQRSPSTIEYIENNGIESLIPPIFKQNLITRNVNQNQNDSINANLHQTFQNSVISQNKETVFHHNPRTDEQNKLNLSNVTSNQSGIIKPPFEPQSNLPIDVLKSNEECLAQLLKCITQTTQDKTKNVELQIAHEKYISALHEMKEQLNYSHADLCQNKVVSNVPVQKEVIQPHTSLSMNQCQTPSGPLPGTHQNLTKSHAQIQPNNQDVMPRQVHHQGSMNHSFPSQIQIHSVHSQAPNAFNKEHHEMNLTNKRINICSREKCGNEAKVLCSSCRSAVYCSKNCQLNHWYEEHHVVCTVDISNQ